MRVRELHKKLTEILEKGYGHALTDVTKVELCESEDPRVWSDEVTLTMFEGRES